MITSKNCLVHQAYKRTISYSLILTAQNMIIGGTDWIKRLVIENLTRI
jgi:hypothetical protein